MGGGTCASARGMVGRAPQAAVLGCGVLVLNNSTGVVTGTRCYPLPGGGLAIRTIAYDGRIMGTTMSGAPLAADRWAAITVPVLFMHGDQTMPFLQTGPAAAADLLPTSTLRPYPDENHSAEPAVLAPAIREFVNGKA
jgi:pimeloyl-ACP methyl ester carboxylesterase